MGVGMWALALLGIVVVLFGWVGLVLAADSRRFNRPSRVRARRGRAPHRGDGSGGGVIVGERSTTNIYGR